MAARRFSAWWAWRPWAALGCAVAGWVLPGQAHAAFADVTVHFIGEPVQSRSDGFGGGAPNAQVVFSGGGDLVPWREGHGDFLLAASASHARGALHAAVDVGTVGRGRADGVASASVVDSLMIGGTQAVDLELRLAVQGSFTASGRNAFFRTDSGLAVGSFSSAVTTSWIAGSTVANQSPTVSVSPGTGDVQVISREPGNVVLWHTVRQTVLPGTVLDVAAFLTVSGDVSDDSRAQVNFGHTAQLWLGLPAGTPFTSRSGVFLTEAPSLPVPEPATWALWLAGLAATARVGRRRGRTGATGLGAMVCAPLLAITLATLAADHAIAQPMVKASVANGNGGPLDSAVQFGPGARRASAFASRQNGVVPYGDQFLASAVADLSSGSIGVSAEWQDFGGATGGRRLTSHGSFEDTLTFHGTGTVQFSLGVVGSFNSLGPSLFDASAQLFVYSEALSTQGGPRISKIEFDWQNLPPWPLVSTLEQGTVSGVSRDPAAITATLQVSIPVRDGDWVHLGASLGVGVNPARDDQARALFGHTAQLRLQMPTGMRFDSASGTLLSAPPPPVPEPAGAWLMLAGLPLLAVARRRGR